MAIHTAVKGGLPRALPVVALRALTRQAGPRNDGRGRIKSDNDSGGQYNFSHLKVYRMQHFEAAKKAKPIIMAI